jgi:hypothetical protein
MTHSLTTNEEHQARATWIPNCFEYLEIAHTLW